MFQTVSARQIQREYKKVLGQANKSKEPVIVISNNKPVGAVIGLDQLEKLRLDAAYEEAMEEYRAGKTTTLETEQDLQKHLEQIDKMV